MAIELGILDWDEVKPFVKRFRQLDIDGSGAHALTSLLSC